MHWCLTPAPGCVRTVRDPNSGQAWDVNLATGTPTFTSSGNSANDVVLWGGGTPPTPATASPDRNYTYAFTDQWQQARCNPDAFASAQRNDADAAVTNLFAMHNRMHDWAYRLGFTEAAWNLQAVNLSGAGLGGDAEQGRAQSGAISGSRNNANQGTPRDGLQPTTNMFLWQPVAGAAYPPCVDGDYDMTVIGHEYTHAITNRMIAGPNAGIAGFQGGSMGEAWGDLTAAEYLAENNFHAPGDSPFVTGAYVTGNTRERDPRLRREQESAQLLRSRVRPGRAGGARRRRDLGGGEPAGPGGVRGPVRQGHAGAAATVCRWAGRGRLVPGQPALGPTHVRLVPAAGGEPGQHDRHARQHARRRHGPLRRGEPGHHLERLRRVRPGSGRGRDVQRHRRDAELRLAAGEQRHGDTSPRSATRPVR